MEDPDWMNDFKTPTEDVLMLSSSSPSSSSSPDVSQKRGSVSRGRTTGKEISESNGKDDDEDSPLITALATGKVLKSGGKGRSGRTLDGGNTGKAKVKSRELERSTSSNKPGQVAAALDVDDDDDDDDGAAAGDKPQVFFSRRSRGVKRVMNSDDEDEEEFKPPSSKSRKKISAVSPKVLKDGGDVKAPDSGTRAGKRVSFSQEQEVATGTAKRVKREVKLVETAVYEEEKDEDESFPLSSLVKTSKEKVDAPTTSGAGDVDDGFKVVRTSAAHTVLKKKPAAGSAALIALRGDAAIAADDEEEDATEMKAEAVVHDEETGVTSERKAKSRAFSNLPVIFTEKVHRTKVLLECEGDALDLSGDMGAVGRFSVNAGRENGEDELRLDLKGIIYKTTIVPSNTFFVVNVGQTEAKVEAIMRDFMQLRPDTNQVEDETIVEGTLEGFAFDFDNEGEPLSTPATASGPVDSDTDEDRKQKKTPTKTQKQKKVTTSKGVKGSRGKGSGKAAKKPRAKARATGKKPLKSKLSAPKSVKAKKA